MANMNWKLIEPKIQDALSYFQSQGVRPTLRTLYYNLVSQNIIGNTKSCYKSLSKYVVEMRKKRKIAWNALEDNARNVYGEFKDGCFSEDLVETNDRVLNEKLESFNAETILDEFFDYMRTRARVDRWANQPIVPELWIEKEALAKTVAAWTDRLNVKVRVNKGYSSWTFIYENARELVSILRNNHEKVAIFYLGDLDPSGVDMERFLKQALGYFGLDGSKIEFKRLCITDDHVREYNLPPRPEDAETLAKLRRDSRYASYDGEFIVELDAMVAFVPEEFRRIITEAIEGTFDRDIYDKLVKQAQEMNEKIQEILDDVKEQAKEKLRDL